MDSPTDRKDIEISLADHHPPPPPYEQHGRELAPQDHVPDSRHTFDTIQDHMAAAKHSYKLWEDNGLITLSKAFTDDEPAFHVVIKNDETTRTSHLSIESVRQAGSQVVAQARLRYNSPDFEAYVGLRNPPLEDDWTPIQCQSGGMIKADSYHFKVGTRSLAWRRRNEHAIGSKYEWKLEDESDIGRPAARHHSAFATMRPSGGERFVTVAGGIEIAAFHGQAPRSPSRAKSQPLQGQIDWQDDFGDEIELMSLVTMVALLKRSEKKHRN